VKTRVPSAEDAMVTMADSAKAELRKSGRSTSNSPPEESRS
jgi:hypothetical protein